MESKPTRNELAKTRIEALFRSSAERSRHVIEFALIGLKSLVLLNGGGIIGILTFLGHYKMPIRNEMVVGLAHLVIGLAATLAAILFSYVAQHLFSNQDHAGANKIFFHEYGGHADEVRKTEFIEYSNHWLGRAFQVSAVSAAICALGCFAYGSMIALIALSNAIPT